MIFVQSRTGAPIRGWTRSASAFAKASGADVKDAQEALGHSTHNLTVGTYTSPTPRCSTSWKPNGQSQRGRHAGPARPGRKAA